MHKLDRILSALGCTYELDGRHAESVNKFASVADADESDICFVQRSDARAVDLLRRSRSRIILCKRFAIPEDVKRDRLLIVVENPRLSFARALRTLTSSTHASKESFIHPTAIVCERARIGRGVYVGAYASIGEAVIGDNTRIESHACIHDRVTIGKSVLVSQFCNIGGNGFGFVRNEAAEYEYFPHIGTLVVEDDVSLFPYVNIDKGTLGETRIGKGTKIDHYCHIGHNSKIGSNNLITPNVTTLGGVTIGDRCVIGCGSIFRENVRIGDDVTVGMGSSVTKDIPNGETWVGVPAREFEYFKAVNSALSRMASETVESTKSAN